MKTKNGKETKWVWTSEGWEKKTKYSEVDDLEKLTQEGIEKTKKEK